MGGVVSISLSGFRSGELGVLDGDNFNISHVDKGKNRERIIGHLLHTLVIDQ